MQKLPWNFIYYNFFCSIQLWAFIPHDLFGHRNLDLIFKYLLKSQFLIILLKQNNISSSNFYFLTYDLQEGKIK